MYELLIATQRIAFPFRFHEEDYSLHLLVGRLRDCCSGIPMCRAATEERTNTDVSNRTASILVQKCYSMALFAAVAGDQESGGSDGDVTRSSNNVLMNPTTVPELVAPDTFIEWNTDTKHRNNHGSLNQYGRVSNSHQLRMRH